MAQEVEDPRLVPLVLAEGLEVQEDVYAFARAAGEPLRVTVRGQRPTAPIPVREPESDVVAERVVPGDQLQVGRGAGSVHVVRRAPAQHVIGALDERRGEAQPRDRRGELIAHDELGVAEDAGRLPEPAGDRLAMQRHLLLELLEVCESREAVGVGLREQLDASSVHQQLELLQRLGGVVRQLVDERPGQGQRDLEAPPRVAHQLPQQSDGGHVALVRDAADDGAVARVVEEVGIRADVEQASLLEAVRLMNLVVDADVRHGSPSVELMGWRPADRAGRGRRGHRAAAARAPATARR